MIGQETKKTLCGIEKIVVNNFEWQIKYHQNIRIIYGLHNMIIHFGLKECESLYYSFGLDGELSYLTTIYCVVDNM